MHSTYGEVERVKSYDRLCIPPTERWNEKRDVLIVRVCIPIGDNGNERKILLDFLCQRSCYDCLCIPPTERWNEKTPPNTRHLLN